MAIETSNTISTAQANTADLKAAFLDLAAENARLRDEVKGHRRGIALSNLEAIRTARDLHDAYAHIDLLSSEITKLTDQGNLIVNVVSRQDHDRARLQQGLSSQAELLDTSRKVVNQLASDWLAAEKKLEAKTAECEAMVPLERCTQIHGLYLDAVKAVDGLKKKVEEAEAENARSLKGLGLDG